MKVDLIFKLLLVTTSTYLSLVMGSAFAKMNCEPIEGTWAGRMSGEYVGPTTLKVKKNCRLSWKLPDGRTNYCTYKEKNSKTEYSCSLGSKGIVNISGNRITMQNVYTARKHGAYTVKLSKQ